MSLNGLEIKSVFENASETSNKLICSCFQKVVSQTLFKGFVLLHVLRSPSHAGATMQQLDNPAILYLPSTIFCTCLTCLSAAPYCTHLPLYFAHV